MLSRISKMSVFGIVALMLVVGRQDIIVRTSKPLHTVIAMAYLHHTGVFGRSVCLTRSDDELIPMND